MDFPDKQTTLFSPICRRYLTFSVCVFKYLLQLLLFVLTIRMHAKNDTNGICTEATRFMKMNRMEKSMNFMKFYSV